MESQPQQGPSQSEVEQAQARLWDRIIGRRQEPAPTPPLQPAPPFIPPVEDGMAALRQEAADLRAQLAELKAAEAATPPPPPPPDPAPLANAVANNATETARLRQVVEERLEELDAKLAEIGRQAATPPVVEVAVPEPPKTPIIPPEYQGKIRETATAGWLWALIGLLIGAVLRIPMVGAGVRYFGPKLAGQVVDTIFRKINDPNDRASDDAVRRVGKLNRGEAV